MIYFSPKNFLKFLKRWWMTSLCDRCHRPGRCCSGFSLNGGDFARGLEADEARKKILKNAQLNVHGDLESCDFEPLYRLDDGAWRWWCKKLGVDGRCTIYDHRPALCRDYAPLHDELCWHFDGVTKSDDKKLVEKGVFINLASLI